jgi:hypothetical protein
VNLDATQLEKYEVCRLVPKFIQGFPTQVQGF